MDRCCDVSKYCYRFKLTKAECLTHLERYQEAQEIAKLVFIVEKSFFIIIQYVNVSINSHLLLKPTHGLTQ